MHILLQNSILLDWVQLHMLTINYDESLLEWSEHWASLFEPKVHLNYSYFRSQNFTRRENAPCFWFTNITPLRKDETIDYTKQDKTKEDGWAQIILIFHLKYKEWYSTMKLGITYLLHKWVQCWVIQETNQTVSSSKRILHCQFWDLRTYRSRLQCST